MAGIREAVANQIDKRRERRDHAALQAENERLRTQNERLRAAMRRCTTCEFRISGAPGPSPDIEGADR